MTQAIYGIFDSIDNAERALAALKDHGANHNEISVVRRSDGSGLPTLEKEADSGFTVTGPGDVVAGAMKGGAAGIALGILAGAVALTIPGIGPILAAGPLAGAIGAALGAGAAGAISGGVVGYFVDQGVPEDAAARYHDALHRGDILVTVRSAHISNDDSELLMRKYGATETSRHSILSPMDAATEPPLVDHTAEIEHDNAPAPRPAVVTQDTTPGQMQKV